MDTSLFSEHRWQQLDLQVVQQEDLSILFPEIMEGIKSHTPRSSNVAIENTNGGVHEKIIYENFPLPRLITGWYLLSA